MEDFERLGVTIVALSQEDDDVEGFRKIGKALPDLPFPIIGDIDRLALPGLERTTAYYVGRDARVRQVFPMETYRRADLGAIRREIVRLREAAAGSGR